MEAVEVFDAVFVPAFGVDFDESVFGAADFAVAFFDALDFAVFCFATVEVFGFAVSFDVSFGAVFLAVVSVDFAFGAAFFGAALGLVFVFVFDELKSPLLLPKSCPKA